MALTYAIINIADIDKIDFSQVSEDSKDTLRKNLVDPSTKFLLKWGTEPTFITDATVTPIDTYTHSECLTVMATTEWSTVSNIPD